MTDNTRISSLVNQPRLSCLQHDYSIFFHIYTTMTDNEPNTVWNTNLPADPRKRRLSMWFVNNQKSEAWDKKALNTLHLGIVVLLVLVYVCHIIGSPYIRFIEDHTALTIIYIVESFALVVSILSFVKMCFVNGSWTATKLLFDKTSVRTYIFAFWLWNLKNHQFGIR